ncbi:S8 family peptidase [Lacrimispora celerecrescens]|uniref:S8 family peptidase n=1 Tax=Lacrimispora celerecrescens TaxID=29354 RepID=UPI001647F6E9|nr:S8 family peptidase [Lacrimispora celerecrescens]
MEKILDNNYYDLMISNLLVPTFGVSDDVTLLNDRFSLLHLAKVNMQPCDLGQNPYHVFPTLYTISADVAPPTPGMVSITPVNNYTLLGQGVIIGIVDTGIDYRHPAFMNRDKTTRILSIWDQTIQDGPPPNGFTYGTEYTKASINDALQYENSLSVVPSIDTIGHGTAIASIVAGSPDTKNSFSGVVPNSELVVVKLKEAKSNLKMIFSVPEDKLCFQESDIVLGLRYLIDVGQRLRRPLVICIALSSSQGSHDGRGVLSTYLESLVQRPDVDVSISAGNQGNSGRHYFNRTISAPHFNDFQLNIAESDKQFSMEIWAHIPGRLSIEISAPDREMVSSINPSFNDCHKYVFQNSQSILWVNNMIFERESGDQLILLRFQDPLPGIWYFRVQNIENEPFTINSWLPSGDLISDETFFLNSNPDITITSPGNSRRTLTAAAYNQMTSNILDESGRGFTRSGYVKPDIAAPGFQIPCAVTENQYGTLTGAGASAAFTAGAIAVIFEWTQNKGNFTYITGEQVNRIIIRGAQRNPAYSYPNNIWGFGQLDLNRVFELFSTIM